MKELLKMGEWDSLDILTFVYVVVGTLRLCELIGLPRLSILLVYFNGE